MIVHGMCCYIRGRNTVTVRLRSATGLQFYAKKPPEAYEQLVVCGELYGQRFRQAAHTFDPSHTFSHTSLFKHQLKSGAQQLSKLTSMI